MNLIRFTPLQHYLDRNVRGNQFQNLWSEMNTLLDSFSDGASVDSKTSFVPALDLQEDEKNIYLHAELPGMDENNIDVSIKDGILTLKGEKKTEEKKENKTYVRVERSYGSFHRSVALPSEVDESKVEATFKNGVLNVTLPKTTTSKKEQKIKIKTA